MALSKPEFKLTKDEKKELALLEMVNERWSSEFAQSLNRAALIALARVHAGLKDKLTVNGSGKCKGALLAMLEPYFERMRATLPRLQRVTALCAWWRRISFCFKNIFSSKLLVFKDLI